MEQIYKDRNLKLVEELESGNRQQCTQYLHRLDNDSWCCLGVACDLASQDGVSITRTTVISEFQTSTEAFNGETSYPPDSVRDYYGWTERNPYFRDRYESAAGLNDFGPRDNFRTVAAAFRQAFGLPEREETDDGS